MSEFTQKQRQTRIDHLVNSATPDLATPRSMHVAGPIMLQQQVLGNQAMQRFAQSCPLSLPSPSVCPFGGACHSCPARVQAKLTVNKPGDKYEQEADRVAEQVMRMSDQEVPVSERIHPLRIQREYSEGDEKLQRQPLEEEEEEEEELVQAKEASGQTPEVTPSVQARMDAMRGGGQPLPGSVRRLFESRFGHDFSQVRIHTGSRAAESARAINAQAYTIGRDIVFGNGQYAQDTIEGQRLLAHELTHVVQQSKVNSSQTQVIPVQRRVRSRYVSCARYGHNHPVLRALRAIGIANPLAVIRAADTRAIELLDTVIDELTYTRRNVRRDIRRGLPIGWPTISDAVADGLRNRFGIDPDSRRVWTGRGWGTVYVLIRRYQAVRNTLNGGWVRYTCLAPANISTSTCAGRCCDPATAMACACEGVYRIFLCRPWWTGSAEHRATTLVHECLHIYFGFIRDTGRLGNAHCYEQFVHDFHGIPIPAEYAGACS